MPSGNNNHPTLKHTSVPSMPANRAPGRPEQLPCGGVSIYVKKGLPQAHPIGYQPSGSSSPGPIRKYPCHYLFSLYTKFWTCMDKITCDILQDKDPHISFVEHVIGAAKESTPWPRATTVPKKSNPWFDRACRDMLRSLTKRSIEEGGLEQKHFCL